MRNIEAIHNSELSKNDIDEVIMGQVLTGGSEQNLHKLR